MEELEREVADRLDGAEETDAVPYRVYALYEDGLPAPATYLEVVDDGRVVPVIAHNFRYYGYLMRRWDVGVVEAIVLNELHELTHWAMTEEERAELDARSREYGLPDGHWLNPTLVNLIDWVGEDYTTALEGGLSELRQVGRQIAWGLRRIVPGVDPR